MLDPRSIDLDELCLALDSRYGEMSWWIDPASGVIRPHIPDVDGEETPEEDGWTFIPPGRSHDGYPGHGGTSSTPSRTVAPPSNSAGPSSAAAPSGAFVVVSALPVAESTWQAPAEPGLIRAAAEAVRVA